MNNRTLIPMKGLFLLWIVSLLLLCGCSSPSAAERFAPNDKILPGEHAPLRQSGPCLERSYALPSDVTAIGDSVMLGAESFLKTYMPGAVVDAHTSRQVWQGLSIVKDLDRNGKLGSTVVIELGTNGVFPESTAQEIVDYLGADRTIFWVTAYGKDLSWQDDVNSVLAQLSLDNDNVQLLDWAEIAPTHPEWFYEDGVHLNLDGQAGFAAFIANRVVGPQDQA